MSGHPVRRERWRPIAGYEGYYEVSNWGRVRGVPRVVKRSDGVPQVIPGVVLQAIPNRFRGGYLQLVLHKNGRRANAKVHRLVLETFVGPCPDGMVACHNDGDVENNYLDNLRWDSASANNWDLVTHGKHHNGTKTHCPYGHPYATNTVRRPSSPRARRCRLCLDQENARRRERRQMAGVRK